MPRTRFPSSVDIAIVGAGAAGLGAARTLEGSGLSVIVLEARDRIGGRAWTRMVTQEIAFDVGCGWLHSADENSFVGIAGQLGIGIDKTLPPWSEASFGDVFPKRDRVAFGKALDAFYERVWRAAKKKADVAAATLLEPGNPWNPMIDAVSTYVNGAELDRISVQDLESYRDTGINWRVREGYGTLIAAYGASCPVALSCVVEQIDHAGRQIKLETSVGTLSADQVIVTVPTNLIADEAIRFAPALPAKVEAARNLPLGADDKVMLKLSDSNGFPVDGNLRAATMRRAMGTYHLRPFGHDCIEGFFGGRYARELEDAGVGAFAAQAIDEIADLLGHDIRRKLSPLAESRWAHDPFARGAYSHALPGHASARAMLAAPVDDRLFFAGEATSPQFFSTAHGARDSGERAARQAIDCRSSLSLSMN